MQALVLRGKEDLVCREEPVPRPGPGELLIRTKAATICTSDINDIKYNHFGIRTPMIMGHEAAGIVEEIGTGVSGFSAGDEVCTHPVMPCGECGACRGGLSHLCENVEHLGLNRGGAFAQYYVIRADRARKKPQGVSFAAASLVEPISVCLEAIQRGNVPKGGRVLILGDGPFGVICSRLLKGFEAGQVIVTGHHPFRLRMTEAETLCQNRGEDMEREILRLTEGQGVDTALLCVGSAEAVNTAIAVLRPRGTLSVFSAVEPMPDINLFRVHVKELNVCGSCNDEGLLDQAVKVLESQPADFEAMVTHRLPFSRWREAFRLAVEGKDEALKVSLVFD